MSAWKEFTRVSGLDVATWLVIGLGAMYLGYRIGPVLLERFLLWIS